jgi:hypothetical protein
MVSPILDLMRIKADARATRRRFDERLSAVAEDPAFRADLAQACSGWAWPGSARAAQIDLATSPRGREVLDAVGRVLVGHDLDPGLSTWAACLGTTGAHDPALASNHFENSLAPKVWNEFDGVLGEPQLHVRVPGTWSSNRVARFVALYDNPIRQMLRGPRRKGGRPPKSDCKAALAEARAFDATLTRRLPRKTWFRQFAAWMRDGGLSASPRRWWRQHLAPSLAARTLSLPHLDYRPRRRS